jgi:hypothetical protein
MNYARTRAQLQASHAPANGHAPGWTNDGPMTSVPHIGRFFADRLARPDVPGGAATTPAGLARRVNGWLAAMPIANRREGLKQVLGAMCQNRRANTCVNGYYIRDINPGCFLSLCSILSIIWGGGGGGGG